MGKIIFLIVVGVLFIFSMIYLKNFFLKVKKLGYKEAYKKSGTFLFPSSLIVCCSLLIGIAFIPEVFEKPLPNYIEQAKNSLNNNFKELHDYEDNHPYADDEMMYSKFLSLQNETIDYKNKLESIGRLDKYNYKFEDEVNKRTQHYLDKASAISSSKKSDRNTCNICNRQFVGRGYKEKSTGLWVLMQAPYQSFVCSPDCGKRHNKNWDNIYRDTGMSTTHNKSTFLDASSNSEYINGSDGRLYENKACSLCSGTGFEKGGSSLVQGDEYRICPMCKGKGVRSY